jgi:molecular chaperone DnaK (HSP70)
VSWAINGGSKNIRLITDWPNPRSRIPNSEKVPSYISYKDGRPQKYGYGVGPQDDAFKWIKILLEPAHKFAKAAKPVEKSNELLHTLDKMATEVVTDYLKYIWEYTLADIRRHTSDDFREIYELKVVLTVPAVWSQSAKDKTLQCARAAGMPFSIDLVTEPEAAALAVLKDKAANNSLAVCQPAHLSSIVTFC